MRLAIIPPSIDALAYDTDKFVNMIAKNTSMLSEVTKTCHEILMSKNDDVMADLSIDILIIVYASNRPQQDFYLVPVSYVVNFEEVGEKFKI